MKGSRLVFIILLLLLITPTFFLACSGDDDDDDDVDPGVQQLGDFINGELAEWQVPGCAVAIIENGEVIYAAGFGTKYSGQNAPVDSETMFRIGSITKMFTATALMDLQREGKLSVDDSVTEHCSYLEMLPPHNPADMTIHHILTHTSGVPDYAELICETGDDALKQWFLDNMADFPYWTPPGRLWNYTNLGYALAGLAVEEGAAMPYATAIDQRVLQPAGMLYSTFDPSAVQSFGNYAYGHYMINQSTTIVYDVDDYDCCMTRPAGYLFSNVEELSEFAKILLAQGSDNFSSEVIQPLITPYVNTLTTPIQEYGYGIMIDEYKGLQTIGHGGAINGYLAEMVLVPDKNFGVIVLTNSFHYPPLYICYKAMDIFLELPDIAPPDYTTDPGTWGAYTGTYVDPYVLGTYPIYQKTDQTLWVTFTDEDTAEQLNVQLIQYAGDTFYGIIDSYAITGTFFRDATGQAEYFATRIGVGKRISDSTMLPGPSNFSLKHLKELQNTIPRIDQRAFQVDPYMVEAALKTILNRHGRQ